LEKATYLLQDRSQSKGRNNTAEWGRVAWVTENGSDETSYSMTFSKTECVL